VRGVSVDLWVTFLKDKKPKIKSQKIPFEGKNKKRTKRNGFLPKRHVDALP
jgi:hypothetical protein